MWGFFYGMTAYLYILHSNNLNKFYIGVTHNIDERLRRHLSNHKGFTGTTADWTLCYYEKFESMQLAKQREKQLKKWKSAKRISELIQKSSAGSDPPD
jgi:putative endonuclease